LIPSQAPQKQSASYTYGHNNLKNGRKYFYKLEDVDIYGVKTMYGLVSATPMMILK